MTRGEGMKLRVVVVTNYSDIAEANLFVGLAKAGVSIWVLCPEDAPHYNLMKDNGVRVEPLALRFRIDIRGIRRIRRLLRETDAQIIHMFNNRAMTNGLAASVGLSVKRVAYRGVAGRERLYSPYAWITYLNPFVSRVVCVSESVRAGYLNLSFMGLRFSKDRFVTIYKGHRPEWYLPSWPDLPDKPDLSGFGIPENAFVVGSVGNMRKGNTKGIPVLLKATELITDTRIHFLIVGKMDASVLDSWAGMPRPLKDRIHFTGERRDAPALMAGVDVYVLPSVEGEGLPKTAIEAMVHGIPPIVTDRGGSPELVVEGESGFVVPAGDAGAIARAVTCLKENPDLLKKMGPAARERITTRFTNTRTIEQTLALYNNIVSGNCPDNSKELIDA